MKQKHFSEAETTKEILNGFSLGKKESFFFSPILTKQKMSMTILQFCSFCAKRKTDNHTIREERVKKTPPLNISSNFLRMVKIEKKKGKKRKTLCLTNLQ